MKINKNAVIGIGLLGTLLLGGCTTEHKIFGPTLEVQCSYAIRTVYHYLDNPPRNETEHTTLVWAKAANLLSSAVVFQHHKNYPACVGATNEALNMMKKYDTLANNAP